MACSSVDRSISLRALDLTSIDGKRVGGSTFAFPVHKVEMRTCGRLINFDLSEGKRLISPAHIRLTGRLKKVSAFSAADYLAIAIGLDQDREETALCIGEFTSLLSQRAEIVAVATRRRASRYDQTPELA